MQRAFCCDFIAVMLPNHSFVAKLLGCAYHSDKGLCLLEDDG